MSFVFCLAHSLILIESSFFSFQSCSPTTPHCVCTTPLPLVASSSLRFAAGVGPLPVCVCVCVLPWTLSRLCPRAVLGLHGPPGCSLSSPAPSDLLRTLRRGEERFSRGYVGIKRPSSQGSSYKSPSQLITLTRCSVSLLFSSVCLPLFLSICFHSNSARWISKCLRKQNAGQEGLHDTIT